MTPSDAVASLRPRPSGPPLRGRAPQSDGIIKRRLFAAQDTNRTDADSTLNSLGRGLRLGVGVDHDGHAPKASDAELTEMMRYFNDETENGKLYISYPMVESIRHVTTDFQNLTVLPKPKDDYLKEVKKTALKKFLKGTPDTNTWRQVVNLNFEKAHFIVTQNESEPERHEQNIIFKGQLTNYIMPKGEVAVLSAFPLFIKDYFRSEILSEILGSNAESR